MIARVSNFKVGVCRGKNEGPIRTMELAVTCRDDPGVRRVFLHFFERKPATLGFVNRSTDSVVCFLPVADFDLTPDQRKLLPAWMRVEGVHELKNTLVGVILVYLVVDFATDWPEVDSTLTWEMLVKPLSIFLIAAAYTLFSGKPAEVGGARDVRA